MTRRLLPLYSTTLFLAALLLFLIEPMIGKLLLPLLAACGAPQVFLDAGFEVLRRRCAETVAARPLFREEEPARLLYESRRPHYLKAQYRLDTASCSVEQAAAEIARMLSLEPIEGE